MYESLVRTRCQVASKESEAVECKLRFIYKTDQGKNTSATKPGKIKAPVTDGEKITKHKTCDDLTGTRGGEQKDSHDSLVSV